MSYQYCIALIFVGSSALHAQSSDLAVAGMRSEWQMTAGLLRRAGEMMSDADFAYRPVATVRTTGQIFAHIADAQNSLCRLALGGKNILEDRVEKTVSSRAELLAELEKSMVSCAKAYDQDLTTVVNDRLMRYHVLAHNTAHNGEHYGNIVTYMRIRGLVPPSSPR